METSTTCWITWNDSTRSRTLASEFNIPLCCFEYSKNAVLRHILSLLWTILILIKKRPSTIYIQYSYVLLAVIALYKILLKPFWPVTVICDCHTKALRRTLSGCLGNVFTAIKNWCFSMSDCAIISNRGLIATIELFTNSYIIFPDILPKLDKYIDIPSETPYFVFSNAFAVDEPYQLIVDVAREIDKEGIKIFWTNNPPKGFVLPKNLSQNIIFTGHIPNDDYYQLLAHARGVIALTTEEDCLQCAICEALALEVPALVSDTKATRDFFGNAVIYLNHDIFSIVSALRSNVDLVKFLEHRTRIKKMKPLFYDLSENIKIELKKRYVNKN